MFRIANFSAALFTEDDRNGKENPPDFDRLSTA
jgi:hypothetical protein